MANGKKFMEPEEAPLAMEGNHNDRCGRGWGAGGDFGRKILTTLAGVLLVYLIFYLGTLMRNNVKKYDFIGQTDQMERTITVSGYGKVTGSNDIAITSIGYSNTDPDVAKAQADNKKVMDAVMADLKKVGIADKDLQSDYSIYPDYNYTQASGQQLKGYRVSNALTVKIRDLSKITAVLNIPGKDGANSVGGLNFTIDDPENLKSQARDKAVADAQMKARKLAYSLGVRLESVVSYSEYENQGYPPPYAAAAAVPLDIGGAALASGPAEVAGGSRDVVMNVNITYKIIQ